MNVVSKLGVKRWSELNFLFSGWISKASMAIPLIGYVILLGDNSVNFFSLDKVIPPESSSLYLSTPTRMKLIYIGLVFVFIASVLFSWKKPSPLKISNWRTGYISEGLAKYGSFDCRLMASDLVKNHNDKLGDDERNLVCNFSKDTYQYLAEDIDKCKKLLNIHHNTKDKSKRIMLHTIAIIASFGYFLVLLPRAR